ncbi:universal stress protein in QAH/OAS sulfhydrylase 3'region-like [Corticium candelabrum]|uniref:universal stress protein in QAH/OAS sulfhydrylase 3'region-like n=1 Tax=Corticium candelabrum TaxID=121492 RepID=UPI002E262A8B|nr:universal stress protein in QAH/OAS sulfhydrylase 3'region-like [Corticium candelabrum]
MSETMAATTAHSAEQPNEQEYILPETASDGSPTNAPRRPDLHLSSDVRPRSSSDAATAAAISTGRIRSSSFTEAAVRSPVRVRQSPQRRVLIAIDGSQGSKNAFDWYIVNLHRPTDLALLVHVYAQPSLPAISFSLSKFKFNIPYDVWQERLQEAIDKAHKTVNQYEAVFQTKKIRHQTLMMSGAAGELICQAAKEHHADMIVMGSRGLNALRRSFLGSISSYTLDHAHIPVVIVPTQKHS